MKRGIRDWRDLGLKGYRREGIQERMETGKEGSESGQICGTGEMRDRRDAGKVRYSAVISSMSRFLLYCVNNSQKANKKFKKEKEDIHEMRMQICIVGHS